MRSEMIKWALFDNINQYVKQKTSMDISQILIAKSKDVSFEKLISATKVLNNFFLSYKRNSEIPDVFLNFTNLTNAQVLEQNLAYLSIDLNEYRQMSISEQFSYLWNIPFLTQNVYLYFNNKETKIIQKFFMANPRVDHQKVYFEPNLYFEENIRKEIKKESRVYKNKILDFVWNMSSTTSVHVESYLLSLYKKKNNPSEEIIKGSNLLYLPKDWMTKGLPAYFGGTQGSLLNMEEDSRIDLFPLDFIIERDPESVEFVINECNKGKRDLFKIDFLKKCFIKIEKAELSEEHQKIVINEIIFELKKDFEKIKNAIWENEEERHTKNVKEIFALFLKEQNLEKTQELTFAPISKMSIVIKIEDLKRDVFFMTKNLNNIGFWEFEHDEFSFLILKEKMMMLYPEDVSINKDVFQDFLVDVLDLINQKNKKNEESCVTLENLNRLFRKFVIKATMSHSNDKLKFKGFKI